VPGEGWPERLGSTYGTLPGHPEQGEEAFEVAIDDDCVRCTSITFPRPDYPRRGLARTVARVAPIAQPTVNPRLSASPTAPGGPSQVVPGAR
jgi:uncharacterized protein (UPF0548 family)